MGVAVGGDCLLLNCGITNNIPCSINSKTYGKEPLSIQQNLVKANTFCQSFDPSLYWGSTVCGILQLFGKGNCIFISLKSGKSRNSEN